jgi:hypothetical protein
LEEFVREISRRGVATGVAAPGGAAVVAVVAGAAVVAVVAVVVVASRPVRASA